MTGPGTQVRMRNTLSGAPDDAVNEKLISENWTKGVVLPKYVRPKPIVWTPSRIDAWRQTGDKPGKVMVWMPEQTGEFLDAVVGHRLYPMFRLVIFRGLRRGVGGDRPDTRHRAHQRAAAGRVTRRVGGHPQSESGERTIKLDSETRKLLQLWRERQAGERAEWEENRAGKDTGFRRACPPYGRSGWPSLCCRVRLGGTPRGLVSPRRLPAVHAELASHARRHSNGVGGVLA